MAQSLKVRFRTKMEGLESCSLCQIYKFLILTSSCCLAMIISKLQRKVTIQNKLTYEHAHTQTHRHTERDLALTCAAWGLEPRLELVRKWRKDRPADPQTHVQEGWDAVEVCALTGGFTCNLELLLVYQVEHRRSRELASGGSTRGAHSLVINI